MASFRFFTSYAHADASDDDLLRTFYSDLSVELKRITGAQNDEFLDTKNIVSGEEWRRSLEGALGSSLLPRGRPSGICGSFPRNQSKRCWTATSDVDDQYS